MRACIQRVSSASVTVDGKTVGQIAHGLVVLLGVGEPDSPTDVTWMANKICGLRIFEDDEGKMNRSIQDVNGAMLIISQFTLLADCRKGRRPSFINAARPEKANPMYESFCEAVRAEEIEVATGIFQADMKVELVNDGPVTLVIDSPDKTG